MKLASALIAGAVSALKVRDGDCDWIEEECSGMEYRWACDGEQTETDCGWYYRDDDTSDEYWVTCDNFDEWEEFADCHVDDDCDYEWYWDECM